MLNTKNTLVKKLGDDTESEKTRIMARQVYMLTLLSQRQLSADELQQFLNDSFDILENNV